VQNWAAPCKKVVFQLALCKWMRGEAAMGVSFAECSSSPHAQLLFSSIPGIREILMQRRRTLFKIGSRLPTLILPLKVTCVTPKKMERLVQELFRGRILGGGRRNRHSIGKSECRVCIRNPGRPRARPSPKF